MKEKDELEDEQDETEIESSEDGEETAAHSEENGPEKASPAARKLEPLVLAHISRPNYQPVKPRVIAKQLKLPSEQHKALKLCIKRLVQQGKLSYGSEHLVRPVIASKQKAVGS